MPFFNTQLKFASDIIAANISILVILVAAVIYISLAKKWKMTWMLVRTMDHRKIGILYIAWGFVFFLRAGLDAMLMRTQLAFPDFKFWVFQGDKYDQVMTTHGTLMIFFVAMPFLIGLMNIAVPLQIGARDLAFPFFNSLSMWLFVIGGLLINMSFVLGGAPSTGWTSYVPLAVDKDIVGNGTAFYDMGVQVSGIGTIMTSINMITTILKHRAPGMGFMKIPLFTWSVLITSILILFAFPVLSAALLILLFDNQFGTHIFSGENGNPVLWQHLFWAFGHPEVYIVILPAFGIFSQVISTFASKRIFGYSSMVLSMLVIGFLSFMVWIHHMFTVGLGAFANVVFAITSMLIAVPTGIKIFNWLFTIRGGSVRFTTAMLYALAFIPSFVIGGVTGVMQAVVPADYQYHDSYFVVAHLHYVMVGGTVLGAFSGFYFWWPKMFGYILNDKIGKWQAWTFIIGFHMTFLPMHLSGLQGMPRRTFTYLPEDGLFEFNFISTMGAYLMAVSVLLFLWNVFYSYRKKPRHGVADPWDGRTMEWAVSSPSSHLRWPYLPVVRDLENLWYEKDHGDGTLQFSQKAEKRIVVEKPTIIPLLLSGGFFTISFGLIFEVPLITIAGFIGTLLLMAWRSITYEQSIELYTSEQLEEAIRREEA
ncbi:cytochrome c oxidase subunit I [Fictibacillus fluitans]|uniref:Cbb3-type cytochrome c oxidase subunit I n=1 Tax=Fictibacillus fluitans TaxID=3058422 RepID=A0ABT8HWP2_9BACL|nr:cbb3-type cytochrome c oxidase subunit I [Fictibacillus sp. NE201]MDN4524900.1 cbb3-type cytochrome c oxidase subunit I [Fictibacillus sp. NE201]